MLVQAASFLMLSSEQNLCIVLAFDVPILCSVDPETHVFIMVVHPIQLPVQLADLTQHGLVLN